ncbi:HIT-like protein [Anaeromyces robustus]|uniref:HIT-like protein n=1 Tax=Anaeromyces robustus TaxID=1754192 RepID=A0A1Y1XK32_9FUNG|nr:HIT-like protein [Anaeromyces robustus]|eukprot:ORX86053.1 HIT-like protein [Anaeromyces robustus]
MSNTQYYFGQFKIYKTQIFFNSKYSFGLVNLKPISPGHVLVIPKRVVKRFSDITKEELNDLFESVQIIGKEIEKTYKGKSLTITIQDGPYAGQTVEHVHVHIIPRSENDWKNNDDIYDEVDNSEWTNQDSKNKVDNDERKPRTEQEMADEAALLRPLFKQYEDIWN